MWYFYGASASAKIDAPLQPFVCFRKILFFVISVLFKNTQTTVEWHRFSNLWRIMSASVHAWPVIWSAQAAI